MQNKVDRILGYIASRPHWDPPPPQPLAIVSPSPWFRGGGTHSLAGEEVGWPQFGREHRHCGTLGRAGHIALIN
jgi:hypothetical protein